LVLAGGVVGVFGMLAVLGVAVVVLTMGPVCTDAKALPLEKARERPFLAAAPPVSNIAHRGASELAPEHSLRAYELALQQGADVLELDLRLSSDRVLFVAHDRTLKRTLGLEQAFAEVTAAQLRALAGARAPLDIDEVLERYPDVRFNLELKDDVLEAASALAQVITRHGAQDRVLVASARRRVLDAFRSASGGAVATSASTGEALDYYVCYLMERTCNVAYSALQLPAVGWLGLTGSNFITRAHERGLVVHFWTVDEPGRMRALIDAGADGIMTNRPDVLARVLEERR
jgi:glycerophosphoryl diester phosphodiesterase